MVTNSPLTIKSSIQIQESPELKFKLNSQYIKTDTNLRLVCVAVRERAYTAWTKPMNPYPTPEPKNCFLSKFENI